MSNAAAPTITWVGGLDGCCELIEQTLLPNRLEILEVEDQETMWDAIKRLAVRGAPAIGVAAAFGVVLGVRRSAATDEDAFQADVAATCDYLATSRPTAVNLFWALDRMRTHAVTLRGQGIVAMKQGLLDEAIAVMEQDRAICHKLGEIGSLLVQDGDGLMTHCNAGGLATAEYGTALAVMFEAHAQGKSITVFANETRPLLQGARLTTWELQRAGIDVTLICDNMAAQVMREGKVQRVFVGADRIARNGDAANKIGTYAIAVLAKEHRIPFYVVAPCSTIDLETPSGDEIPIEERPPEEVTEGFGSRTAPEGVKVYSPAFDVTPARFIAGVVTERGLITPVTEDEVVRVVTS
ncbi:MAG: S-methyl-5-thioribose-1-phosphate isomerase [Planctomycetes bacterium]|nr:S-methyl-5-thioribose-1-phosphate isomerase [Planctomycetota bacterium]